MRVILTLVLFFFVSPLVWSQENDDVKVIDSLYKEDQFYIGVTYNLIGKNALGLKQSGFSSGFHFGYTKDMPLNKARNVALGLGLGLSLNSFNQNMLIDKSINNTKVFSIATGFTKNRFSTYMLEIPLEFRWRTSTATNYKFWRIYTGFKLGYVFANTSRFEGEPSNIKLSNIGAFNNIQYGISLSAGYNTWNFYFYYALNPIFNTTTKIDGQVIDINAIKIGLIFYLL